MNGLGETSSNNYNNINATIFNVDLFFNVNESFGEIATGNYNRTNNIITTLFKRYPPELLYFAAACCILFFIIGVPGNFITIVALAKSRRLRNATSAFIISLCVADGLYCMFTFPLAASTFIHKTWIFSNILCQIYPLIRYSNSVVSVLSVIAITINRYVIIVHPKIYPKIYTKLSISIIILFMWLLSFAVLTPTAFGIWGKFAFNPEVGTCTMVDIDGKSSKNFIFIMGFFMPSLVFVFCYSRIFWTVRKSEKKLNTEKRLKKEEKYNLWDKLNFFFKRKNKDMRKEEKKKLSKDLKVLRVILVIFLAFVICYFPVIFVKIFKKEMSLPGLNIIGYIGAFCTACVNPIIYVIMSKEYRRAYKELFVCSKKYNSNVEMLPIRL